MTNTDRRKRALLARTPKRRDWTQEAIDDYHARIQKLQEQRAQERRARQREILAQMTEEEED